MLVLESMKMETVLHAPFPARVKELLVMTGSQVETGAPLVRLEPTEDDGRGERGRRGRAPVRGWTFRSPRPSARPPSGQTKGRAHLTATMLGFDIDEDNAGATLENYLAARDALRADGVEVVPDEIDLLGVFADLAELSRNRPADEEQHTELRVHSSKEHFHTYLQSLDVERGGLPEQFSDRLRTVLGHYGVTDLEPTPSLQEAVFRIFLAQRSACRRAGGDHAAPALERGAAAARRARRTGPRAPGEAGPGDPAAVPGHRRPGP